MFRTSSIPDMFLFDQGRRHCYGAICDCISLTKDVRFASCSEINFEVPKKYYNSDTYKWVDNTVYDHIEKHNTIYVADDTEYFSFPNRAIAVCTTNRAYMDDRLTDFTKMTFSQNSGLWGFTLQNETKLFDISVAAGYNWQNLSKIDSSGSYAQRSDWGTEFPNVACTDFIPLQPYDIIAVRSRWNKGASISNNYNNTDIKFRDQYIHFYSSNEAASYLGTFKVNINLANPVFRFSVNSLSNDYIQYLGSSSQLEDIKNGMANGGYIRVSAICNYNSSDNADTAYPSYYKVETISGNIYTTVAWSYPYNGWLQIYSGDRRCTSVSNVPSSESYGVPLHWFVIDEVEEVEDGITPIKRVKLYSYEYILSRRTTSLSPGTMALYIPETIVGAIESNNWTIDRTKRVNSSGDFIDNVLGAQHMQRGLLNMILDDLPQWSVGHISSNLMARYREFSDVDNIDVYTFLTNDVARAYQCYFVFDSDNMTISAYSQDDIIQNSNITLNWNNAIKHLTITNSSVSRVTALHVHTSDDQYGLGLVNPYGGSTIYNFDSVIDQMDFVADTSDNDPDKRNQVLDSNNNFVRYRTLKEAVQEMVSYAATPTTGMCCQGYGYTIPIDGISISNLDDYKYFAKKFVQANLDLIKAKTKYREILANYHVVADKINAYLKNSYPQTYQNCLIPDKPPNTMDRTQTNYSPWHSKALYYELVDVVDEYWEAYREIMGGAPISDGSGISRLSIATQFLIYKEMLSHVAQKLNLNYRRQRELILKYPNGIPNGSKDEFSILTPNEILALQPYIIEGDWTNENAVFSDTYGADDIVDTLADVMEQANTDLTNIYSKDNYDFETDTINWTAIEEMQSQAKRIKVGQTVWLETKSNKWVCPVLLELHINYKDDNDFKMTFTTDYNRKPLQFRFADLYGTITQTSVTDSTFTFNE